MKAREAKASLDDLGGLSEIVGILRTVAASELRRAEKVLASALEYRRAAEDALARVVAATAAADGAAPPASGDPLPAGRAREGPRTLLVVFTSALGMSGDFNDRMLAAAEALAAEERAAGRRLRLIVLGSAAADRFADRDDVRVLHELDPPTSVDGLPDVMGAIASAIAGDVGTEVDRVEFLAADYDAPGRYTTVRVPILPLALPSSPDGTHIRGAHTRFYLTPQELLEGALDEVLFSVLYWLMAETLASEHGARVNATQQAHDGLDREKERLTHLHREARQTEITDEIMEVAGSVAALTPEGAGS